MFLLGVFILMSYGLDRRSEGLDRRSEGQRASLVVS